MQSNSEQAARARCEAVRDELPRWLAPAETIFFGPALAEGNDPPVPRLRARGAHFFWVAVPLGGAPFSFSIRRTVSRRLRNSSALAPITLRAMIDEDA